MASREANLKHRYGITLIDYNEMLVEQDSRCKICNVETTGLVVDHCHNSGEVRGLLCGNCNKGLGLFKDSPERMERAAKYILESQNSDSNRFQAEVNCDMGKLCQLHGSGIFQSNNAKPCTSSFKSKCGIGSNVSFIGPFLEDLQTINAVNTVSGDCKCD